MRIATFNVRHCTLAGRAMTVDIEATAAAAGSLEADVLALQELDAGLERSEGVHQPDALALLLGMNVAFAPAIEREGRSYGIALCSGAGLDGGRVLLPGNEDREPRVLWAGRTGGLSVVTTHLSTESAVARRQLQVVVDVAVALPEPRVVTGDLNLGAEDLACAFGAGFRSASSLGTWPRRRPRRSIDHVLVSGDVEVVSAAAPLLPVSDHRPLVVELRI